MGAEFNFERLEATSDETALAEGLALIKQAAWDYGHAGYTGSFAECNGVSVDRPPLEDEAAAKEWLLDNAEKWGPMLIVKTKDGTFYAGAWCSS